MIKYETLADDLTNQMRLIGDFLEISVNPLLFKHYKHESTKIELLTEEWNADITSKEIKNTNEKALRYINRINILKIQRK